MKTFVILYSLFSIAHASALSPDMERVETAYTKCMAAAEGVPLMSACASQARHRAEEVLGAFTQKYQKALASEGAKHPRFREAARYLQGAQKDWQSYVEGHCHFQVELNNIPKEDMDWRFDSCAYAEQKLRDAALGSSFWK